IVFVAERLLEAFVRKLRLLNFSAVDCFEFRYVEANGTAGFYLDRVDWAPRASGAAEPAAIRPERLERLEPPVVEEPIAPPLEPRVAPREEPKLVLLREAIRDDEPEEPQEELREELREEPRVTPVDEPRIVMLHESKPALRIEPKPNPRAAEPASTNGAPKDDSNQRSEPPPAVLKGPAPEPPRAVAPPPPSAESTPRLAIQPFAADIQVSAHEVAPDEVIDEPHDSIGDLTEKQRKIFQGLTLPDNGELAPQWR